MVPISRILIVTIGLAAFALVAQARTQQRFAASDTTAMIRGTVSGYSGLPLAGVKVVATAKLLKAGPLGIILGQDSTFTSDSGSYALPNLDLNSPGTVGLGTSYYLIFSKAGYRSGQSSNLDIKPLNPGDTVTFNIHLAKIIDLTVLAGKAGVPESPSAGANIIISQVSPIPRANSLFGVSDTDGLHTFTDIDSGAKSITVSLEGYRPAVVRKSVSGLVPKDTVRILLQKSNPDSTRTLVVSFGGTAMPSPVKDTMVFSAMLDSLTMNLPALSDSGVFTFRDIPDSYSTGILTWKGYIDTTTLNGPVTQKKFTFHGGQLPIEASHRHGSGSLKRIETPEPDLYYFDGKSGKSFNVLGKARAPFSAPATKP